MAAHEDVLQTPDGATMAHLRLVGPSFAAVVAVTDDDKVVFVRNYRPVLRAALLEIPGGLAEPGEAPSETARRELAEETGYLAGELVPLGWYYPAPSRSVSRGHLFLGRKLRTGTRHPDATEEMRTEEVPVRLAYRRLRQGRIRNPSTFIGLSLAERWLLNSPTAPRSKRLIPSVAGPARSGVG